jgi:ABC-2 type transport system permease protein
MTMRPFIAIIIKDLKLHAGNRRALILTLLVPIAIASFFGGIFGGQSGKTKASGVPIQVVDLDQSGISREIVTNLSSDSSLKVFQIEEAAAREAIRNGNAAVAVIFPKNFGADATRGMFGGGTKPELTILHDPSRNIEASMVQGILMQHIMQAVSKNVFSGQSGRQFARDAIANIDQSSGIAPDDARVLRSLLTNVDEWLGRVNTNESLKSNGPASDGLAMPFKTVDEASAQTTSATAPAYNGYAHSFGGMSMQFVLMAAIECGLAILLERQRGLWRRLRSAPVSRGTLLAGRAASSAIIALGTLAVCWTFSMVVFHVRVSGSWPGFILCNAALAVFAASMGLFIAALGRTPEATRGIAIFVILILVMLGGAWVPAFIFPEWLQKITLLIPTRWAMDGFDGMTWRGLGFSAALAPAAVLLGYALVCALLAHRCFRWEAD